MNTRKTITMLALSLAISAFTAQGTDDGKKEWSLVKKLYTDEKACKIGDLLTVIIIEEATLSKDAKSTTAKKAAMSGSAAVGHPRIDNRDIAWTNATLPSFSFDANNSFEGGGTMANKDTFNASITVRVMDVAPNGNLMIEGKRAVILQEELMEVTLTGTVRQSDVARDNTIKSTSIADATIKYNSNGPINQNQKKGLITRVWERLNPF